MEILDNYLDTMFSRYPLTPKTEEAKRELRAMMEDAYNGALAAGRSPNEALGQAISEFGNIDEVAPILGLASFPNATPDRTRGNASPADLDTAHTPVFPTDGDDWTGSYSSSTYSKPGTWNAEQTSARSTISLAHARNYAEAMRRTRWMLGIAVALITISPTVLMGFGVAFGDDQNSRSAIGLIIGFTVLLPLLGIGIGLLIWRSQQLSSFRPIREGMNLSTPEVEAFANGLDQQYSASRTRNLIIAIGLWILAGLPIISAGVFTTGWAQSEADPVLAIGLVATMVLVASGLLIFLPSNWAHSASVTLLQTSPATVQAEMTESGADRYPVWVRVVLASYWLVITTVYLAWSFITGGWNMTWIIWPIAGVVFATFAAVVGAIHPPKKPGT